MSRESVYAEMKEALGLVPGFFQSVPDHSIDAEWELFKRFELLETSIPPKYRELIGTAVAAAGSCWYCANFHSGLAKFHGATDEEVQEAVHLAKFGVGWSAYLNGTVYDRARFSEELEAVGAYLTGS